MSQILVLGSQALTGIGPQSGGGGTLPAGSSFGTYGDSLSYRSMWQPTVAAYFNIPWINGGIPSTCGAFHDGGTDASDSGCGEQRLTAYLANCGTINTIWFGANDWALISQGGHGITVGTNAQFGLSLSAIDRTTYAGAIAYMIQRFYTAQPLGLHILVQPSFMQYSGPGEPNMTAMQQVVSDAAQYFGCPLINMWRDPGINAMNYTHFLQDNVHSADPGALRWANVVISRIQQAFWATTLSPHGLAADEDTGHPDKSLYPA